MANFIGLVYATLKNEGIDTKGMDTDEAIKKYNELQEKTGGKSGKKEPTPAENKKLKEHENSTSEIHSSNKIAKMQEEKQEIGWKLEEIKREINEQYNKPNKSLDEISKSKKLKDKYERELADINTLEEREKHPGTKIFRQNNLITDDLDGSMVGNYDLFDENLEERNKYFESSFNDLEESLGYSKHYLFKDALAKYTEGDDQNINNMLNSGSFEEGKTEEDKANLKRLADRINDGINNFETIEPMTVYRSDTSNWVIRHNFNDYNWDDLIGKEFTENQFLSTSLDKAISEDFNNHRKQYGETGILFEIKIPQGKGVGMPTWNHGSFPAEQEYLLNSNSKFKITNVRKENGKVIIEQEMIKN